MAKPTPAPEITPSEAPPKPRSRGGKPIATEKHTVVTEWEEKKKIGVPSPPRPRKAPIAEEFEEDEDETPETEVPDSAHALFEEYGVDEGLMMDVNRLPDYTLNRRTDPASWHWITMMPYTPSFKQEIALRHARPGEPNWFLIVLKDSNGRIIKRDDGKTRIGPFAVEAATNEERQQHGIPPHPQQPNVIATINQATPYPYPPQLPPPVIDEDTVIDRFFSRMERWDKMARRNEARQENGPQVPAPMTEEDILIRAALSSEEAQQRVSKGLLGKILGGAAAEADVPWYADVIKDVAMSVAPGLNELLKASAGMITQIRTQPQQMPQTVAALPEQAAPQLEPLPIQSPVEIGPEDELFGRILGACARRQLLKPEVAARSLLDYTDQFTDQATGYNKFSEGYDIFITNNVKDIINLAAMQNPIAARMAGEPDTEEWLTALQSELKKELSGDGSDQDQQP